jgi:hypothetical protein
MCVCTHTHALTHTHSHDIKAWVIWLFGQQTRNSGLWSVVDIRGCCVGAWEQRDIYLSLLDLMVQKYRASLGSKEHDSEVYCNYKSTHIYIRICMYVCMHSCIYIYIYIYISKIF